MSLGGSLVVPRRKRPNYKRKTLTSASRRKKPLPKMKHLEPKTKGTVRVGRLIAGEFREHNESLYPAGIISSGGIVGSHGTLEYKLFSGSARKRVTEDVEKYCEDKKVLKNIKEQKTIMEISREIPEKHQNRGIGTKLLLETEEVARKNKVGFITAKTANEFAEKSYKRLGWIKIWQSGKDTVCYGKFLE